jgi:DNA repair exonuclease SbcCD ATPase subunit
MRPLSTRITFELILGAVLVTSLVIILRLSGRLAESTRQHSSDAETIRSLQDALRRKGLAIPVPENGENPASGDHSGVVKREAVIARLDHDLAESNSNLADLQAKLSAANDQIAQLQSSGDARLQKQQADSQAQLDDLQKKLDAAQSAADIAHQRSAVLEADNSQLKSDSSSANARADDVVHIISNLQDLERRREVYLTNILRRYRDITDEFHAMSSIMDTSHDAGSSACGGAALSRIQSAVTSAEDDMRQMNEINARSQKLEKQLAKK